jgi:hypothetical protein
MSVKWSNQTLPFRQAQGPELIEGQPTPKAFAHHGGQAEQVRWAPYEKVERSLTFVETETFSQTVLEPGAQSRVTVGLVESLCGGFSTAND